MLLPLHPLAIIALILLHLPGGDLETVVGEPIPNDLTGLETPEPQTRPAPA